MAWHGGVSKFNNPDHHKSICYDTWAESHHPDTIVAGHSRLLLPPGYEDTLPFMHATMSPNNPGLSEP